MAGSLTTLTNALPKVLLLAALLPFTAAADELRRVWPERRILARAELDAGGADAIAGLFQAGDAVLLKGSRGVELERIAAALARRGASTTSSS